jgi:hypothetical protein
MSNLYRWLPAGKSVILAEDKTRMQFLYVQLSVDALVESLLGLMMPAVQSRQDASGTKIKGVKNGIR